MTTQSQQDTAPVTWFYSFGAPGWFSPAYNTKIPGDGVEVPAALRSELLEGVSDGLVVVKGPDGLPQLAEPPPLSEEQLAVQERRWRDKQLLETDPLVIRHRDEHEAGETLSIAEDDYQALQAYRIALRHWPQSDGFPANDNRPQPPDCVADLYP